MPANIATIRARKARSGIARRQIGHAYRDTADLQQPFNFPEAASYTFTAPASGRWKFIGWGPGGSGAVGNPGASGSYFEITKLLPIGATVAVVCGIVGSTNTSVTFQDGTVATAGRAAGGAPGTATGGDVNLAGSAPGVAGLGTGGGTSGGGPTDGAGAPANLPYRGGNGLTGSAVAPAPGAGGGDPGAGGVSGGGSCVIATLLGD
jgi:hypothetical protein